MTLEDRVEALEWLVSKLAHADPKTAQRLSRELDAADDSGTLVALRYLLGSSPGLPPGQPWPPR